MVFAAGIASGKTMTDAYTAAHPGSKAKRTSTYTKAATAAKSAAVQYELARLLTDPAVLRRCPNQDPAALEEHALAVMVELSKTTSDPAMQFKAAAWIVAYAQDKRARLDALKPLPKVSPAQNRDQILAELRSTYARSLPPAKETAGSESAAKETEDSELVEAEKD